MKPIIIMLLLILTPILYAQSIDDVGKVVLGVEVLDTSTKETIELESYLTNKLSNVITQAGYSTNGITFFYVSPNIIIDSDEMAEAGMKNVYVVQGSLILNVIQNDGDVVFSSLALPFRESSTKRITAIKNGISKIQSSKIAPFLEDAKGKILKYYESEKEKIFIQADVMAENKNYDGAIAYVMSIPNSLHTIYQEALVKADFYLESKNKMYNDSLFVLAKSYLAQHDAKSALDVLCAYITRNGQEEEYKQLLAKAEKLVTEEEKRIAEEKRQKYLDDKERQYREWKVQDEERAHRINMETQQMAYDREALASQERLESQRISAAERLSHHTIDANERVETYRIYAIKSIAQQYYQNNR